MGGEAGGGAFFTCAASTVTFCFWFRFSRQQRASWVSVATQSIQFEALSRSCDVHHQHTSSHQEASAGSVADDVNQPDAAK